VHGPTGLGLCPPQGAICGQRLMGVYTNGIVFNVLSWATIVIVSLLTLVSTSQSLTPS
jgi:Mn2+/Fe2+ NRAMP family transporter